MKDGELNGMRSFGRVIMGNIFRLCGLVNFAWSAVKGKDLFLSSHV
jgi:hypothetical protein